MADQPNITGVPKVPQTTPTMTTGAMSAPGETAKKKKPFLSFGKSDSKKRKAVADGLEKKREDKAMEQKKFFEQEGFDRDEHSELVAKALGSFSPSSSDGSGLASGGVSGLASAIMDYKDYTDAQKDRVEEEKKEAELDALYAQLNAMLAEDK
jgi:hypothetical protein